MRAFESLHLSFVRSVPSTWQGNTAGDCVPGGAQASLRRTDVDCGAEAAATLIALTGEIDASNSAWLTVGLETMITSVSCTGAASSSGVVIDLTRLRFCDASGITSLIKAFKHAQDQQMSLKLAGARGRVDRVLRLTGIDGALTLYPEPADALRVLGGRT